MDSDAIRMADPFAEGSKKEQVEIGLLLEAVYRVYGYDFRHYASDSIRRRIIRGMQALGAADISSLVPMVVHDPESMRKLLGYLYVNFTEMFRDPTMFKVFREKVVPFLRTYPHIRIWHAGCSTGEEVLSMAILLQEEGLYDKSRIYATDMDEDALEKARAGIFPLRSMKTNTHNYIRAGGTKDFSDYYTADYDAVIFNANLKKNIVYGRHNLAMEESFNEFNVIFCRNVLIYFDRELQNRVHRLFHDSLSMFGFLVLGDKESLQAIDEGDRYEPLDPSEKMYRKIK